ncbi:hypothetical protein EON65_08880 [archaeon]|nr:MAG: hypothetical protein EON65_08880 [archaeon]
MECSNFDDSKNISNFTWGEIDDDKGMDNFDPNLVAFDDFYSHSKDGTPGNNTYTQYAPLSPPSALEGYSIFSPSGPSASTQKPSSSSTCFFDAHMHSPGSTLVSSTLSPENHDMSMMGEEIALIHYEDGTPLTLEQVYEELQSSLDSVTDPVGKVSVINVYLLYTVLCLTFLFFKCVHVVFKEVALECMRRHSPKYTSPTHSCTAQAQRKVRQAQRSLFYRSTLGMS